MSETAPPEKVASLQHEVEELRARNETLQGKLAMRARFRRAAMVLLLILGCGLTAAALVALWTRATVLNTDRYVSTMAPIAASPAVQETVADKLDTKITSAIDFDALARDVLPQRADVLAPAIATGAENAIRDQLDRFVASERFQELWNEANRRAHDRVVGLLTTGRSGRLELEDNTVFLDLSPAVDRIKERLTERGLDRIAAAIPPTVDGQIPLFTSDGFATARKAINVIKGLSILLPILALLCFAGYVLMSRPRRRGFLHVALGLAVTGLLLLGRGRHRPLRLPRRDRPERAAAAGGVGHLRRADLALPHRAADHGDRRGRARRPQPAGRQAGAGRGGRRPGRACAPPRRAWPTTRGPPGSPSTAASSSGGWCCSGGLVLVAWDNPTAWVVLIDAALIALAVWLIAVLARSGRAVAG